jgi:beta-lactamase superfamily II metal-dependent hydrolase
VAIYMAGTGNRYGHPHQETLAALARISAKVYGTDVNGTITVSTDSRTFVVQTER